MSPSVINLSLKSLQPRTRWRVLAGAVPAATPVVPTEEAVLQTMHAKLNRYTNSMKNLPVEQQIRIATEAIRLFREEFKEEAENSTEVNDNLEKCLVRFFWEPFVNAYNESEDKEILKNLMTQEKDYFSFFPTLIHSDAGRNMYNQLMGQFQKIIAEPRAEEDPSKLALSVGYFVDIKDEKLHSSVSDFVKKIFQHSKDVSFAYEIADLEKMQQGSDLVYYVSENQSPNTERLKLARAHGKLLYTILISDNERRIQLRPDGVKDIYELLHMKGSVDPHKFMSDNSTTLDSINSELRDMLDAKRGGELKARTRRRSPRSVKRRRRVTKLSLRL